jgi:AraC family ethanolamine operon transcriptional activator
MKTNSRYHQVFTDIDVFARTVWGWELNFRQLDRIAFHTEVRQVSTETVLVSRGRFASALEQRGGSPAETWTFALLDPSSPGIVWRGQRVAVDKLMIYPPGSEIDAVSPRGFDVLTISVSMASFSEWDSIFRMADKPSIRPLCVAARIEPRTLRMIRISANALIDTPASERLVRRNIIRELNDLLCIALQGAIADWPKPSLEKKNRLIRKVNSYIDDRIDEPITLVDLCRAANASPRTLQRLYKERFGLSPKAYLKIRRLNGVKQAIQKSRDRKIEKISDLANIWGFWHMGQFAADYKRFFGELPSHTLKKP